MVTKIKELKWEVDKDNPLKWTALSASNKLFVIYQDDLLGTFQASLNENVIGELQTLEFAKSMCHLVEQNIFNQIFNKMSITINVSKIDLFDKDLSFEEPSETMTTDYGLYVITKIRRNPDQYKLSFQGENDKTPIELITEESDLDSIIEAANKHSKEWVKQTLTDFFKVIFKSVDDSQN